jgi:hypothetical protein
MKNKKFSQSGQWLQTNQQAVVVIPSALPKTVLGFGSVSPCAGHSCSGFASRSGEERHACRGILEKFLAPPFFKKVGRRRQEDNLLWILKH